MASKVDFVQIIYKEEQEKACYPFARIHFNNLLTPFFENSVIVDVVESSKAEKISVCSWKLKEKMRWNVRKPRELTEEVLNSDYSVLSFTGNTRHHQFLRAAEASHPGFTVLINKVLISIGKSAPSEVKNPIYQNHFCASSDIYKNYVREYLKPAMDMMINDKDYWKDSGYSNLNKSGAVSGEYLKEKIGVPYYPMHPFILERMFSIFCHNENITVTYL